jgi:outer membrane receptor for ferrienterochelin and colicin
MSLKSLSRGCALAALAIALSAPVAVYAQETTSSIRGEITGPNGPIAGATIVITHTPSGTRSTATTGASGQFNAAGLRVGGPFTVQIAAAGFQAEAIEGLFITLGEPFRFTRQLEPVRQQAAVIVTAAALQGGEAAIGSATALRAAEIATVVSVTRDIRDIARRSPLVTQDLGGGRGGGGQGGISIAGSGPRSNRIAVDGVQSGDDFGLNTGGLSTLRGPISLEAVEQFTVQAAPFDVENGDFTGGALTIALKQGGNNFEGSLFANYLNEGLVGERIRGATSDVVVTQENWGAFLAGPILQDRLFFAASYETYTSADITPTGLSGAFANRVNGLGGTTGSGDGGATGRFLALGDVTPILQGAPGRGFVNNYASASRFGIGDIAVSQPVTDEKYSVRIDWNITDQHRASLTHRNTESSTVIRNQINATNAGFSSAWYGVPESETVNSLQINSDWTDTLSTELRISRREYERGQAPLLGLGRGQVQVCLDNRLGPNPIADGDFFQCNNNGNRPTLVIGPDRFRHANSLATENTQVQFSAEYIFGDHLIKAGAHWQEIGINNLFVQAALGVYYFDTIEAFNRGELGRLEYNNALTGNPNDGAAVFTYNTSTLFVQDTWDITDNLVVTYGLRYEIYGGDEKPAANPNFVARNGFANTTTYDGLDVLMPRASFEWNPTDTIEVSGGVGLVSGGLPDVFLSNSFSNTGILTNSIDIRRTATGCIDALNPVRTFTGAECSSLLTLNRASNDTFFAVPGLAQTLVGGGAPVLSETNALAPNFEIPSDWRANVAVQWDVLDWLRLGFDFVGVRSQEGLAFRDSRSVPLVANGAVLRTPDGRIRYDGLSATAAQRTALGLGALPAWVRPNAAGNLAVGDSRDIIAFNPGEDSWFITAAVSASASFDNGVEINASYTRQDSDDFGTLAILATTAGGLYGEQYTSLDPNLATSGRSNSEITDSFKLELAWEREFLQGLPTRFSLFGENRTGVPISFLQGGGPGRNATYGVNRGDHLLYVPNMANPRAGTVAGTIVTDDARVVFNSQATYDFVNTIVNRFGLSQGAISQKGAADNPDINRLDLQISQELPGFWRGHRTRLTFDIQNVLNLVNDEWGVVEEFSNRRAAARIVDMRCASATGVLAGSGSTVCDRYLVDNPNTGFLTPTRNADLSRWYIQIGLKYEF